MNKRVRRGAGPVWVGMLDLDHATPVVAMNGPLRADHRQARVLVRLHGAPLGYVRDPALPEETLSERIRAAAGARLAAAIVRHTQWDQAPDNPEGQLEWAAKVTCPRRFPSSSGGVTVLVPTRNRPDLLGDCLRAIQRLSFEQFEVLVVDNAPSGDETRAMVTELARSDSRLRYVREPRAGRSCAINRGLAEASYEIVAIADDDVVADSGWLSAIAAGFAADPEVVGVTGLVCSRSLETGSERYFDARYPWGEILEPRRYDLTDHRHRSPLYPFRAGIFGTGANFAIRRQSALQAGGFDPLLGPGAVCRAGEDLDLFLRIVMAGGRISYLPSALVWHQHRAHLQGLTEQVYSYGQGLGAYLAKHLKNRELRNLLLRHGLLEAARPLAGRIHQASAASELGTGGRLLTLYEMLGVMPGAFRYWSATRRASQSAESPR